jgi:N-carbamoylputrescine amidase
MTNSIRAALVQTNWTGDKESMIKAHEEYARQAAAQGAKVICFQELFYGPYFCQVQDTAYYAYAESVPGPTVERFSALAAEVGMVMVLPMYEQEQPGVLYNTAAVLDADGQYLGKFRKTHIPQVKGFWEKFYFRPGNLGYPTFDTAVGRIGVYICYDRHFPEGWRALGLAGAQIVFNPSATHRGLSPTCGSWSSRPPRWPTSTSSAPSTGSASRVRSATTTSTERRTSSTRRESSSARPATRTSRS